MLCQVSKDYTINYSWNEKMYHDYLRNRLIWEKTMEETLNELKQTFGDNPEVKAADIQRQLKEARLYNGEIDGLWGPKS